MTSQPISHAAALDWTFADRIRKIRRDVLGIEQAEFAEKLGVGRQAYAAWESGRNEPRSILAVMKKIQLISGVSIEWQLGLAEKSQTMPPGSYETGSDAPLNFTTSSRRRHLEIVNEPLVRAMHAATAVTPETTPTWRNATQSIA